MSESLLRPEALLSLLTLTGMEIVLGIDNVVFLSILSSKLPASQQPAARRLGLAGALLTRLGLLLAISWVMGLTDELFHLFGEGISGRDLILLGGGLFLIGKSTLEVYERLEVEQEAAHAATGRGKFISIVIQIMLLDIVFSLDSVITAVGMAQQLPIMIAAMVLAMGVMLVSARKIGDFVNRHPSMKILALSFLLLIGVMLVAEGLGQHISRGYIYFAMAFSLSVELLNMAFRARQKPVALHARREPNA